MEKTVLFVALALLGVGCAAETASSPSVQSGVISRPSDSYESGSYGSDPDSYDLDVDTDTDSDSDGYPAYDGYDLDCADIGHPVEVDGSDRHGLDRDGDGIGCETW